MKHMFKPQHSFWVRKVDKCKPNIESNSMKPNNRKKITWGFKRRRVLFSIVKLCSFSVIKESKEMEMYGKMRDKAEGIYNCEHWRLEHRCFITNKIDLEYYLVQTYLYKGVKWDELITVRCFIINEVNLVIVITL